MFDKRHEFDGKVAGVDPYVFASEYAVTGGGGNGNLIVRLFIAADYADYNLTSISGPNRIDYKHLPSAWLTLLTRRALGPQCRHKL